MAGVYQPPPKVAFSCCILDEGIMNMTSAAILKNFSLVGIQQGSDEWRFYIDMLFGPDTFMERTATFYRRDSLRLLLTYYQQGGDNTGVKGMPFLLYELRGLDGTPDATDTSIGWFYYAASERIHFALESIFSGLLVCIQKEILPFEEVVSRVTDSYIKNLKEYYSDDDDVDLFTLGDLVASVVKEDIDYTEGMVNSSSFEDVGDFIVHAIEYLVITYQEVIGYTNLWREFSQKTATDGKNGNAMEWIVYFSKRLEMRLDRLVAELLRRLVNDHLYISYSKMGNGDVQVNKLLIEDNCLIHINNVDPQWTSPRLGAATNFLRDLGLIESQAGEQVWVSEEGLRILNT